MLAKCANPDCSTPLIYLREGKIFMMDHAGDHKAKLPLKPGGNVEHFWLCGPCSAKLTLICSPTGAVRVIPREPRVQHAGAS